LYFGLFIKIHIKAGIVFWIFLAISTSKLELLWQNPILKCIIYYINKSLHTFTTLTSVPTAAMQYKLKKCSKICVADINKAYRVKLKVTMTKCPVQKTNTARHAEQAASNI